MLYVIGEQAAIINWNSNFICLMTLNLAGDNKGMKILMVAIAGD